MVRATKKPITISAYQWFPEWDLALSPKTGYIDFSDLIDGYYSPLNQAIINTLEGPVRGSAGDWIIIGVNGERDFCKDSIFKKTYDFVRDETNDSVDIPDL